MIDVDALLSPPTPTARLALETVQAWSTPDLANHCLRSWAWASTLGDELGLTYDRELLFVATMLHDLGVTPAFDAHAIPFEDAGGAVGWVFAAGAGWPEQRRTRVREIIERHMWTEVDPEEDAEGHLLEVATSLDVAGAAPERWDGALLQAVTTRLPRGAFSEAFARLIHDQAARKPASTSARLDASGRIPAGAETWRGIADPST
ncbi:HD domain-containing protein [Microbacterium gilvum]|uniref:HD domain-containing protein n=1 Tax=Microbacterium gilvum TaxID=1336204 RepID=A0ABP9A7M8_9MICO